MLTTRTRNTATAAAVALGVLAMAAGPLLALHLTRGVDPDSLATGLFTGVVITGLVAIAANEYAIRRASRRWEEEARRRRHRPGGPANPLTAAQARQHAEQRLAETRAQWPEIGRIAADSTRTRPSGCYTPPPTGHYIPPEATTTDPDGRLRTEEPGDAG